MVCAPFALPLPAQAVDSLSDYQTVLDEVNAELGINYTFPTVELLKEQGDTYSDLVQFYTSMSLEEFRNYVIAAYDNELDQKDEKKSVDEGIAPRTTSKIQRYYYSTSNNNNLFISATTHPVNDEERYNSINSWDYTKGSYPYYKPNGMTHTFGTGNKTVDCVFDCVKYVSKNLIDATKYKIRVTFRASGGDVYATTES